MSAASPRQRAPILAGLALLTGALVGLQLTYPEPGLLYLTPALLLLAMLACDRYPGERLLRALARGWRQPMRRGRHPLAQPPLLRRSSPRGGVLLAMALAGRGPPA